MHSRLLSRMIWLSFNKLLDCMSRIGQEKGEQEYQHRCQVGRFCVSPDEIEGCFYCILVEEGRSA